jgi:MFS family permease
MSRTPNKASIWLALKNANYRRYWIGALTSGTCVAAHNIAVFSLLGKIQDSAFIIALMSTLTALPLAIFTLPAGALADIVDRKKILCGTNLWQASVAFGLAILGLAHWINPYVILASAFLFGSGFAFAAAAATSVEVEMVRKDQLASAVTLGGLQMNIAGIIGPLLGGLLIPIVGTSSIFGLNGLGFLLLFLAILRWKRDRKPTSLGSEHFFSTITSAFRYLRYTRGIRVVLARIAIFTFFISIIPALMPVIGLEVLHLDSSKLGYLFTALAIGSVIGAVVLVPMARARFSPERVTFYANLLVVLVGFLMALVHQPYVFLVIAALGGAGWTLVASELWVAAQRSLPEWARGRMNATIIMIAQGATALAGVVWGWGATTVGVIPTFIIASVLGLSLTVLLQVVHSHPLSIDFTADLNLEPAAVTIFSHNLDPMVLAEARENPVSVVTEFAFDPKDRDQYLDLFREVRKIYLRNGASNWYLYRNYRMLDRFQMEVLAPSWTEYQRQFERLTRDEKEVFDKLYSLHSDSEPPGKIVRISFNKYIIGDNIPR